MINHRALLRQSGEALYGERWQSELARTIGVSDRTMRRWLSDPYEIPGGVWSDIQRLLLERLIAIDKLQNDIVQAIPHAPNVDRYESHVMPTSDDCQIFFDLPFEKDKLFTSGNVDRRKYERLESIGWVSSTSVNLSDVHYELTPAGRLELALLGLAAKMRNDLPDPAPNGFQTHVNSAPRRTAGVKLKVGKRVRLSHETFVVDAIEGNIVTVRTTDGETFILSVPAVLIDLTI